MIRRIGYNINFHRLSLSDSGNISFLTNHTRDLHSQYKRMTIYPTHILGDEKSVFISDKSEGEHLIQGWLQPHVDNMERTEENRFMPGGYYTLKLNVERTVGDREVRLFIKVFKIKDAEFQPTIIKTSGLSNPVTSRRTITITEYIEQQHLDADHEIGFIVYAKIGSGTTNTSVSLYYEGNTHSRISIPLDSYNTFAAYLRLNQLTQQTIKGGIPLLDETRTIDHINHLVDKLYVDSAVTSLGARYYMLSTLSGVTQPTTDEEYLLTSLTASAEVESLVTATNPSDDDFIAGWISPVGEAPTKLIKGVYEWDIFAAKTGSGNKKFRVYWTLVERKSDDSEVVIGTSAESNLLGDKAKLEVPLTLSEDYTPDAGSRIIGKVYARLVSGSSATDIVLYSEGNSDSHWEIPTNIEVLQDTFEQLANKKTSLAENSDTFYPSQKAVKTETDKKLENIESESIADLSDVDFDSGTPIDGQALVYDAVEEKWKAATAAEGSVSELSDLSDVDDTTSTLTGKRSCILGVNHDEDKLELFKMGSTTMQLAETVSEGDVLYRTGMGKMAKAKADSATTLPAVAVALEAGNTDDWIRMVFFNAVQTNGLGSVAPGSLIWVSQDTAGEATAIKPQGGHIQLLGFSMGLDWLFVNPNYDKTIYEKNYNIKTVSDNYNLLISDAGNIVRMNSSTNKTITIPTNSHAPMPVGTKIKLLRWGTGEVAVQGSSLGDGVTLRAKNNAYNIDEQYAAAFVIKVDTDEWVLEGSIKTV